MSGTEVRINGMDFEQREQAPFGVRLRPQDPRGINVVQWIERNPVTVYELGLMHSMIVMEKVQKDNWETDGTHSVGIQREGMNQTRVMHLDDPKRLPEIAVWYPITAARTDLSLALAGDVETAIFNCRGDLKASNQVDWSSRATPYYSALERELATNDKASVDPMRIGQISMERMRNSTVEVIAADTGFQSFVNAVHEELEPNTYNHNWRTERNHNTAVVALNKYDFWHPQGEAVFHRGTFDPSLPVADQSALRRRFISIPIDVKQELRKR